MGERAVGSLVSRLAMLESSMSHTKLTEAMNAMRQCGGTTLNVRHCAGVQIAQYFHRRSFLAAVT